MSKSESAVGATSHPPSPWKSFWFWFSIVAVLGSIAGLVATIVLGVVFPWFASRFSGVYTPMGAVLAASLASFAAVCAHYYQIESKFDNERAEANSRREASLWERFHKAVDAFSSESAEKRAAGVYALCGVADDWLLYRRTYTPDAASTKEEAETIVDLLAAHLRQRKHLPLHRDDDRKAHEKERESVINNAIISQFGLKFNQDSGNWSNLGMRPDLYGADLTRSLWANLDCRDWVFASADMKDIDLKGALLGGANFSNAILDDADLSESDASGHQVASAKSASGIIL